MYSWERIEPIAFRNSGEITRAFLPLGISDLREAARWIQSLRYGRNARTHREGCHPPGLPPQEWSRSDPGRGARCFSSEWNSTRKSPAEHAPFLPAGAGRFNGAINCRRLDGAAVSLGPELPDIEYNTCPCSRKRGGRALRPQRQCATRGSACCAARCQFQKLPAKDTHLNLRLLLMSVHNCAVLPRGTTAVVESLGHFRRSN